MIILLGIYSKLIYVSHLQNIYIKLLDLWDALFMVYQHYFGVLKVKLENFFFKEGSIRSREK